MSDIKPMTHCLQVNAHYDLVLHIFVFATCLGNQYSLNAITNIN